MSDTSEDFGAWDAITAAVAAQAAKRFSVKSSQLGVAAYSAGSTLSESRLSKLQTTYVIGAGMWLALVLILIVGESSFGGLIAFTVGGPILYGVGKRYGTNREFAVSVILLVITIGITISIPSMFDRVGLSGTSRLAFSVYWFIGLMLAIQIYDLVKIRSGQPSLFERQSLRSKITLAIALLSITLLPAALISGIPHVVFLSALTPIIGLIVFVVMLVSFGLLAYGVVMSAMFGLSEAMTQGSHALAWLGSHESSIFVLTIGLLVVIRKFSSYLLFRSGRSLKTPRSSSLVLGRPFRITQY